MSSRWIQCESGYLLNLDRCTTIRVEIDEIPDEGTFYSVIAGDGHILASHLSENQAQEMMDHITYNVLRADSPS